MYLVIIASLLACVGNFLVQKWVRGQVPLALGMIVYFTASLCWAYAQRTFQLSRGVVLYNLTELTVAIIMAVYIFGERLTWLQWFGVALGMVSVVLVTGK